MAVLRHASAVDEPRRYVVMKEPDTVNEYVRAIVPPRHVLLHEPEAAVSGLPT